MRPLDEPRYERKFLLDDVDRHAAESLVRRHPALFVETFPTRTVHNVYFDTPGRRDYRQHVEGVGMRSKLRVRWYGVDGGPITRATVEIKTRRGLVSTKRGYPIDLDGVRSAADLTTDALVVAPLPRGVGARLRTMVPVLANRYRRGYFRSADGRCRLTIDDRLSFARPDGAGRRATPVTIIELKYGPADDHRIHDVAARFPFRITRSSKYCLGVEALARSH